MRAVVQRVTQAKVEVDGKVTGEIKKASWCWWALPTATQKPTV